MTMLNARLRNHVRTALFTVAAAALVSATAIVSGRATGRAATEPPKVGDTAPDFTLSTIDGAKVTLSTELKAGPVVLIMGRGWVGYQCPFCNQQFGDFLKNEAALKAAGARVIWVYPGPTEDVQKRAEEFAAGRAFPSNFRFVLDPNYAFTVSYGLRWNAPQESAYPATFVIDSARTVRYALVSHSHGGRAAAADVLTTLAAIRR